MDRQWFEGLSDTLRTLADAIGGAAPAPLVRLQRDLEAAYDSRPATIAAARQWLDRLDASVAEVAAQVAGIPGPDAASAPAPASEATFWADALVRQCRIMRDELAFLAPWSALPAAPSGFGDLPGIREIPTLRELAALEAELLPAIERRRRADASPADRAWLDELGRVVAEASHRAAERIAEIERLALQCDELARMEYDFLYDQARHLLAIGYNVDERRRDPSYYDLLASEARFSSFVAIAQGQLKARAPAGHRVQRRRAQADPSYYDLLASEARFASFVAIAQGQLPQENWFALGRLLTTAGGNRCSCPGAARCSST